MMGLGSPEILFVLVAVPLALATLGFWIWMLIDCATQEPDPTQKIVWVLIILFVSIIGAPLYFFVRKLPRVSRPPARS